MAMVLGTVAQQAEGNLAAQVIGMVILALLAWLGFRWAVPNWSSAPPSRASRLACDAVLFAVALAGLLAAYLLGYFAVTISPLAGERAGNLCIHGRLPGQSWRYPARCLRWAAALLAGVLVSFGGGLGHRLAERLPSRTMKIVNLVLAAAAGVVLASSSGWSSSGFTSSTVLM